MLCQIKDINYLIFNKLEVRDLNNLSLVSKSIKNLLDNNIFWMNKCVSKLKGKRFKFNDPSEIKEIDWKRFYNSRHMKIFSNYLNPKEITVNLLMSMFDKVKKEERVRELNKFLDAMFPDPQMKEKVMSILKDLIFPNFYKFINRNEKRRFIVIRGKQMSGKSVFTMFMNSLVDNSSGMFSTGYLNKNVEILNRYSITRIHMDRQNDFDRELIRKLTSGQILYENVGRYYRSAATIVPHFKLCLILENERIDIPDEFNPYADYIDFNVSFKDSPNRDDTVYEKISMLAYTLRELIFESLVF